MSGALLSEYHEALSQKQSEIANILRQEAKDHINERNRLNQLATKAYESGQKQKAKEYSEQAKKEKQLYEEAEEKAADKIFEMKNERVPKDQIDLHGLYVQEAMIKLEKRIDKDLYFKKGHIVVIHGKGNHSENHKAKIKPAMEELVKKKDLKAYFGHPNDGCTTIIYDKMLSENDIAVILKDIKVEQRSTLDEHRQEADLYKNVDSSIIEKPMEKKSATTMYDDDNDMDNNSNDKKKNNNKKDNDMDNDNAFPRLQLKTKPKDDDNSNSSSAIESVSVHTTDNTKGSNKDSNKNNKKHNDHHTNTNTNSNTTSRSTSNTSHASNNSHDINSNNNHNNSRSTSTTKKWSEAVAPTIATAASSNNSNSNSASIASPTTNSNTSKTTTVTTTNTTNKNVTQQPQQQPSDTYFASCCIIC